MITIATWNINSIKARLALVKEWLAQNPIDFVLLQEIKCTTETFPAQEFNDLGYQAIAKGQPAYHGVALLSRHPVTLISDQLLSDDTQARYLEVQHKDTHLINIYAPNGNPVGTEKFDYKLRWLEALYQRASQLRRQRVPFLIAGDFNIIPEDGDARRPDEWIEDALMQPQSRQWWHNLCELGLIDAYRYLHPHDRDAFTFWDYQAGCWPRNNGIRIDHALVSPQLADRLEKCWIDRTPRGLEKPSDHTPLIVQLDD
jgi:exodeoxyribonuclease-3